MYIYIGPMICIGREIQCLPYAGFFISNNIKVFYLDVMFLDVILLKRVKEALIVFAS